MPGTHSQPADLLGTGQGLPHVAGDRDRAARDRRTLPAGEPDGAVDHAGHRGDPALHAEHAAVHDPGDDTVRLVRGLWPVVAR